MTIEFTDHAIEHDRGVIRFPVVVDGEIQYFGIPEAHIRHLHARDEGVLAKAVHLRREIEAIIAHKIEAGDVRAVWGKRYIFL